ncbi:cation-translocating P-type ATPase, partial [Candidatus Peregrinibacteria bacterium]|nr:cation-translocating P-type ATPase [Candidatus Peregrinibacteria bacterium]
MSKSENITVEITGMSCASCAQRIESAIGSIEGVSESIVNFATRKATVTGSVPAEEIHKIIEGLGYNVVKEDVPSISEEEIAQSEWKRFLTSAVLSVPVFIISMFMLHFKFSDLCQLVLTTAVIFWPGIGFFKN